MLSKPDPTELLQNYLVALNLNPVRTKGCTSAVLNALGELIASIIAKDKDPSTGSYLSPRIVKMGLYGLFVSGPLSHYLLDMLQRAFKGRTSGTAKLLQILASMTIISPITNTVFLVFMAIFAGARTPEQIYASWKLTILPVMRSTWCTSPFLMAFAQKYVPKFAWTPFFSLFAFFLSTYNNVQVKRRRKALLEEQQRKQNKQE